MPDAPSTGGGGDASQAPTAAPEQPGDAQVETGTQGHETAEREGGSGGGGEGLPGLVHANDPADQELSKELFGEGDVEGEDEPEADPKPKTKGRERPRGPDGRFLKDGEGQEGDEPPAKPPGSEDQSEPAEKFEFAGRQWSSQEEADQAIRSGLGMIKPLTQQRDENWQAYKAWESYGRERDAEVERLNARIAELESGKGNVQPGSGDGKGAGPEDVTQVIDWDAYEYVLKRGSPRQAGDYLIERIMSHVNENVLPGEINKLRDELMEQVRPMTEKTQLADQADAMTQVTVQMAGYKTPDGRDAFPELKDPEQVEKIGYFWAKEANSKQEAEDRLKMLSTPAGLMNAVALYRLIQSMEEAPKTEPAAPPPDLPTEPVAPGASATVEDTGRAVTRSDDVSGLPGELAGLDSGDLIDHDLGFARNPSAQRRR